MGLLQVLLIGCSIELVLVSSYSIYQDKIPNGDKVPNPCANGTWRGVGHKNMGGGGKRNPFGLDFFNSGAKWTVELCRKDSDGDGKTNGEELGDPDCVWKENSTPKSTAGLSHPGICEPMSSTKCKQQNYWMQICPTPFDCPAFRLNTTEQMELRIPKTKVPTKETTYMCIGVSFPNDTKYHAVGLKPLIDNVEVVHHMVLYGCSKPLSETELKSPWQCLMGLENCQTIIGLYGTDDVGQCTSEEYGFPLGRGGFQYAVMQLHWNNPRNVDSYYDNSGLILYYTEKLRPHDGQILMIGQQYLHIPPRQKEVVQEATCGKACTKMIQPKTIYIANALLHMHLQGKSGTISLMKQGKEPMLLLEETEYDYNTPIIKEFDQHYELNAGDELHIKCVFQSLNKDTTTYYGEGTQEEMCFGFLAIYPAVPDFDICGQWRDIDMCSLHEEYFIYPCDTKLFFSLLSSPLFGSHCAKGCDPQCQKILDAMKLTGCVARNTSLELLQQQYWPKIEDLYKFVEKCDAAKQENTVINNYTCGAFPLGLSKIIGTIAMIAVLYMKFW